MLRKTMLAAMVLAATPVAAHAQSPSSGSPDAARMEQAQAIITIMFPPAERDRKMHDVMSTILGQMKGSMVQLEAVDDPGLKAILDRFIDEVPDKLMPAIRQYFPTMLEATAEAYTHEFSLDELKQIHAFAQTPAGHHYFSKVTDLLKDPAIAKANQKFFEGTKDLQQKEGAKLKEEVMAYLKAHPEVVKKLQAANR